MKLILEETNLIDFNDGSELAPELEKVKEETIKETNKELEKILDVVEEVNKDEHTKVFPEGLKESLEESDAEEEITTESIISGLVKSVWDSVTNYKASLISLNSLEGAAEVIEDIIGDLYVHIGQLQGLTTEFVNSEAVEAIEQGKEETAEILNQPEEVEVEIEDDDIPEEVVEKLILKRK